MRGVVKLVMVLCLWGGNALAQEEAPAPEPAPKAEAAPALSVKKLRGRYQGAQVVMFSGDGLVIGGVFTALIGGGMIISGGTSAVLNTPGAAFGDEESAENMDDAGKKVETGMKVMTVGVAMFHTGPALVGGGSVWQHSTVRLSNPDAPKYPILGYSSLGLWGTGLALNFGAKTPFWGTFSLIGSHLLGSFQRKQNRRYWKAGTAFQKAARERRVDWSLAYAKIDGRNGLMIQGAF